MFRNYFKTALRSLWRNKGISFINLFGLSVSMTAAVFVFLWVNNETSYDSHHADKENIYRITNILGINREDTWTWEDSPYPMADVVVQEVPGVKRATRLLLNSWRKPVVNLNNSLFTENNSAFVDQNWFNVFDYVFLMGSAVNFAQDRYGMVLSESKARQYFGNSDPIGRIVRMDTINYTVKGVVKDNPVNSSFRFDVIMPMASYFRDPGGAERKEWGVFNFITFVQLRPDADRASITGAFNSLVAKYRQQNNHKVTLQPLAGMYFDTSTDNSELPHGNRKAAYIFSLLGVLIAVIACINYVNLTTAKASLRAKEVSVRKIVGAGKLHLFFQFMVESLIISVMALLFSVLLMQMGTPVFNTITGRIFDLAITSPASWKLIGIVLIAVTLLNGIYPAILLSSFRPLHVFRGKTLLKLRDGSVRKGLVVFQFALSMMLITGTMIIYRQMKYIQSSDPGYNVSQVFALQVPFKKDIARRNESRKTFFTAIKTELQSQPGIVSVTSGGSEIVNITSASSGGVEWDGRDTSFKPTIAVLSADADYKDVFRLQLQSGRWFSPNNEDNKNFILNETAAASLGLRTPILGQRFSWNNDTGRIIGIVKDFHYKSLHEKVGPLMVVNNKGSDGYLFVKAAPGNVTSSLAAAKKVWTRFLPEEPFDYHFLDERFQNLYKSDRSTSRLVLIFSIIAIIISSLGLFGLASFLTEQRRKEVGIRKVLGASVRQITTLLSKDFARLVALSILIAVPLIWGVMQKWLENFAYRTEISWWIFGVAGIIVMLIAFITISSQAIRAAVVNPVNSLRSE